jgi:hypothetical protein
MMDVIVTIPPNAPWIEEVASHPVVGGLRFNTVMPLRAPLAPKLARLKQRCGDKPLWIDLKTRQVRTRYAQYYDPPAGYDKPRAVPDGKGGVVLLDPSAPVVHGDVRCAPWSVIRVMDKISVDLSGGPITCYFNDGLQKALLVDVIDGDQLVFLDGPKKRIGPGESINILHPSFRTERFLNDADRAYVAACLEAGIHHYMLSYVEQDSDLEEIRSMDPRAVIGAKIESPGGVDWVTSGAYAKRWGRDCKVRLIAACGDLYVECGLPRPEKVLRPIRQVVAADSDAWLASRVLSSLRHGNRPDFTEFTSIAWMSSIGYRHLMIGEEIFMDHSAVMLALDMLRATFRECQEIERDFSRGSTAKKERHDDESGK